MLAIDLTSLLSKILPLAYPIVDVEEHPSLDDPDGLSN